MPGTGVQIGWNAQYWCHFQGPQWIRASAGGGRTLVLLLTKSETRLRNLMSTLRRMPKPSKLGRGGKGMYWFGVESDLDLSDPLTLARPIWQPGTAAGDHDRESLLGS